ncbi:MAG: YgiT-type zinc finger protein [Candidatus Caldarchaeum sp.]
MRCAVCGGVVRLQNVQEEIVVGTDHYMVAVRAEVCQSCGERYFSERTAERLVQLRAAIQQERIKGEAVGRVYEVAKG